MAKINVAAQQDDPGSLLNTIRHMITVRQQHNTFGRGDFNWLMSAPGLLLLTRAITGVKRSTF